MTRPHQDPTHSLDPASSATGDGAPIDGAAGDPLRFIGRDASWLEFNRRVLAEAMDDRTPLLERVKFLTIFASNLDEFFMKRVGMLKRRAISGLELLTHDGRSVRENLAQIRASVMQLIRDQAWCYQRQVLPALQESGIQILGYAELNETDRERLDDWFRSNVFPILTPLAVDPGHRFPFISNLSENLGILVAQPGRSERLFARLKIPDPVPRLISLPKRGDVGVVTDPRQARFVPLEQILRHNLDDVFPGMQLLEVMPFRVTRSTGVEQEAEVSDDLLEHVETELHLRRFAETIRLETGENPSPEILDLLKEELELDDSDIYSSAGPLEYADLGELLRLDRTDLKDRPWVPVIPPRLRNDEQDIFAAIRERDIFVHHPYESFKASVERFIAQAAKDPNVLAIKQTIYRTSRESPFVESLIRAAEDGKQVAVLVELRARFDESKNVTFARMLENHGVHVAYGLVGLKTHCKCSLVVRKEHDGLRCYAHVGTGNYHPGTALLYTDCGLLTCDPVITDDVVNVFNHLTGRSFQHEYRALLVAPHTMRRRFYELIDREAANARQGKPARILAKMNQLEDVGIINRLYEASNAGVRIHLVVRGFCCLRPGVAGISENITVTASIGRFLEHSRIFHFANGRDDPIEGEWFIASADWMVRNLSDRVEVGIPIRDLDARKRLNRILELNMSDRRRAWELMPDGTYARRAASETADPSSAEALGIFEALCAETVMGVRGHP